MSFYVIDVADRTISWGMKEEEGERFTTLKAAEKRAKELAGYEPGKTFEIVQSIAEVECPVGAPNVVKLK